MPTSTILSDNGVTSGTNGLKTAGGDDGTLILQTTTAGGTATAAITIDANQRSKFPTTIGVGDATPSTSGSGISFPATQSASSDANTLDDYEEGTWTASVGGNATYNDQTCFYTKIGRVVYVNGILFINNIGTGSASTVSGLPFTSSSGNTGGSAFYYSSISSSAFHNPIPALTSGSATSFGFSWNTAGATTTSQFRGNLFQNSSRIEFGFFYFAS
jgi:hypothetical protein